MADNKRWRSACTKSLSWKDLYWQTVSTILYCYLSSYYLGQTNLLLKKKNKKKTSDQTGSCHAQQPRMWLNCSIFSSSAASCISLYRIYWRKTRLSTYYYCQMKKTFNVLICGSSRKRPINRMRPQFGKVCRTIRDLNKLFAYRNSCRRILKILATFWQGAGKEM